MSGKKAADLFKWVPNPSLVWALDKQKNDGTFVVVDELTRMTSSLWKPITSYFLKHKLLTQDEIESLQKSVDDHTDGEYGPFLHLEVTPGTAKEREKAMYLFVKIPGDPEFYYIFDLHKKQRFTFKHELSCMQKRWEEKAVVPRNCITHVVLKKDFQNISSFKPKHAPKLGKKRPPQVGEFKETEIRPVSPDRILVRPETRPVSPDRVPSDFSSTSEENELDFKHVEPESPNQSKQVDTVESLGLPETPETERDKRTEWFARKTSSKESDTFKLACQEFYEQWTMYLQFFVPTNQLLTDSGFNRKPIIFFQLGEEIVQSQPKITFLESEEVVWRFVEFDYRVQIESIIELQIELASTHRISAPIWQIIQWQKRTKNEKTEMIQNQEMIGCLMPLRPTLDQTLKDCIQSRNRGKIENLLKSVKQFFSKLRLHQLAHGDLFQTDIFVNDAEDETELWVNGFVQGTSNPNFSKYYEDDIIMLLKRLYFVAYDEQGSDLVNPGLIQLYKDATDKRLDLKRFTRSLDYMHPLVVEETAVDFGVYYDQTLRLGCERLFGKDFVNDLNKEAKRLDYSLGKMTSTITPVAYRPDEIVLIVFLSNNMVLKLWRTMDITSARNPFKTDPTLRAKYEIFMNKEWNKITIPPEPHESKKYPVRLIPECMLSMEKHVEHTHFFAMLSEKVRTFNSNSVKPEVFSLILKKLQVMLKHGLSHGDLHFANWGISDQTNAFVMFDLAFARTDLNKEEWCSRVKGDLLSLGAHISIFQDRCHDEEKKIKYASEWQKIVTWARSMCPRKIALPKSLQDYNTKENRLFPTLQRPDNAFMKVILDRSQRKK